MLKREDLRGLSSVIVTLLIILLVIVAIAIIWVIMRNSISNQSEFIDTQKDFFAENIAITYIKMDGNLISLSLEKTGGNLKTQGEGAKNETFEIAEADIISVVDISGSMAPSCNGVSQSCCSSLRGNYNVSSQVCSNVNPIRNITCTTTCAGVWVNKLSAVQDANKELINIFSKSQGSRVGIVAYNTNVISSASLDLTNDLNQLNNRIDSWQPGGRTCICCGINEALRKLQQQSSDERMKKIIVMSDGEANIECLAQNTHDAAQDAIKASCDGSANLENLIIYTIRLGGEANEDTLRQIANCGGGKYFSVLNISELVDVYRRVVVEIQATPQSPTKFSYLYIVFYNETTSYKEKILEIPNVLVIKNYNFDLTGKLEGEIKKIEVYPVIISPSGKEIIGPLFDSWEAKI
jgi:Mg-chelatase subunit ChlD